MLLVHPEPVRVVCGIALLLRFVFLGEESHTHVLEGITAHRGPSSQGPQCHGVPGALLPLLRARPSPYPWGKES